MKIRSICLLAFCLTGLALNAYAAGELNLVKPVVPENAVQTVKNASGKLVCANNLILQKNGLCCPAGTNNNLRPGVCTPAGTIDDQIFNKENQTLYCPGADMFIAGDKSNKWFSCAAGNSTPFYSAAKKFEGGKFCRDHGYGVLIKIKPWGAVGCIKYGDSLGDGCIEAGTCSFSAK